MSQCSRGELNDEEKSKILEFINMHRGIKGALIPILHEVQEYFGYIPYDAQKIISKEINVPISDIYGVITFYSRFSLKPTGKYKVSVCLGTACYVKGSDKILQKVEEVLNVKAGDSSEDGMYSVEATRCVGACGLAPVMMVGDEVYGKITVNDVEGILSNYK